VAPAATPATAIAANTAGFGAGNPASDLNRSQAAPERTPTTRQGSRVLLSARPPRLQTAPPRRARRIQVARQRARMKGSVLVTRGYSAHYGSSMTIPSPTA